MKSAPPVRVLVVEDQGMFREFLVDWLSGQTGFVLAGAAASGEEALAMVETTRPDVAIVDFQLPGMDGLRFVSAARQVRPQLRALVLSSLVGPLALTRVRESGVEGYLEKDAPPAGLEAALRAVASGSVFFSPRFRETLARTHAGPLAVGKILSRREQEILGHVLAGCTSREISERIGLSPRTVEFHRANVMSKLGASNAVELLAAARQSGLA